ncbi:MAG: hypothetical protein GXP54_08240, partial [Deltaproteobacteria bacterium]|nr:hypothetical protein [Deltaproteobacteria bacterium]
MSRFEKGAAVAHAAYGRGTVTAKRHNGFEVRVAFCRYSLWIPVGELETAPGGLRLVKGGAAGPTKADRSGPSLDQIIRMLTNDPRPEKSVPERSEPEDTEPRAKSRSSGGTPQPRYVPCVPDRPIQHAIALESFRLGIVPAASVAEWTIGRETEVELITGFLKDDAEGAIVIEGAYGAGKTHLLARLAGEAEGLGFAVASAGFDPSEATAAFPKKAYRRLARGFRATLDGTKVDFRGFLKAVAARSDWRDVLGDHWALGPFLERLAAGRVNEMDWTWIEARGQGRAALPTLHDFTTCANLYCSLLSGLGRAAEMLGLNGLAVLLDEAEVASNVYYSYQFHRGLNFFRGLVM